MSDLVRLLIVDDDAEFRGTLARRFNRIGVHVLQAGDGIEAQEIAARHEFDVAILDMIMPGMTGVELLVKLKAISPQSEIVLLTGQGTVETAVAAIKSGAYDCLTKPFPLAELEVVVQKAYERHRLSKENLQLKVMLERAQPSAEMIGESPAMLEVFRVIQRAGPTDAAILIQGESGVGKELVARALHRHSWRNDKPLIVINCAALPETLLESELFGHEKGAFTGAVAAKPGLFEVADGGTMFIDEIGEMAGSVQAKLLRVLENGSMRRIGSLKEQHVDVRLLAATNRNLAEEVKAGRFREDLYYRINVMSFELPNLRDRVGDIPLLIRHFLGPDRQVEPAALAALERYHWPGNVRQLINALERAKVMAESSTILLHDLPREVTEGTPATERTVNLPAKQVLDGDHLSTIERTHLVNVLIRERGNKARAARSLGINRRSLYRLLEKHNVQAAEIERPMASG